MDDPETSASPPAGSPPPERGRTANDVRRVGVETRFNRTPLKTERARHLRREATKVETRLWYRLRSRQLGVDFRRQHPVGPFILDFYCPKLRLAIELDGGQHATEGALYDEARSRWLAGRGVRVLRFWNSDVTGNLDGVLTTIAAAIAELEPSSTPTRRWRADLPLAGGGIGDATRAPAGSGS